MIRQAIRRYLGITEIQEDQSMILRAVTTNIDSLRKRLGTTESVMRIYVSGIGRVIAVLDPNFGIPEDDPRRKADSDRMGNDIIKKLKAEDEIRRSIP